VFPHVCGAGRDLARRTWGRTSSWRGNWSIPAPIDWMKRSFFARSRRLARQSLDITKRDAREKFSPLAACWTSELGGLNKFVHTWVYRDLNERARIREESHRPGGAWPTQIGVWPVRQENKLMIPAAFLTGAVVGCGA
jgi:hypothetical protein